jgi:hypothetical protein
MRFAHIALFVVLSGFSAQALAQNNTSQSPRDKGTATGITGRQAPVGHRQPTTKDLPADVLQNEQRATPSDKKGDKRSTICKGC